MKDVVYLSDKQIISINVYLIKKYSPGEMIGVRDAKTLDMIINTPKLQLYDEDAYPSIIEKTAIYMIQLVKRHVFQNANKRTALVASITFLKMNGYDFSMSNELAENLMVEIATWKEGFDGLKHMVENKIHEYIVEPTGENDET